MKNNSILSSFVSSILIVASLFFIFAFLRCQVVEDKTTSLTNLSQNSEKQKGAHVFGIRDTSKFEYLKRNNLDWVTQVPWGFQKNYDSAVVTHHNGDSLRMQESDSEWLERLALIHAAGFKIFFKPHIWINEPSEGTWRSDIFPANDENWELWKSSYRDFILRYAKLAEQAKVEMFCIGIEFSKLSVEKPFFWKEIIKEVRSVYSGKITYAANWYKEYEELTFWADLDYIGIQAYFPLVKNENPTVKQISEGWTNHALAIEAIHKKYDKKVLFTEMGYKSTTDSAIKPWEWIEYSGPQKKALSMETQANCYKAFYEMIWPENWFEGVHIWQIREGYQIDIDKTTDMDFFLIGKPAEKIIAKGFE